MLNLKKITSAPAQSGGGSFKGKKPIGEVDGCDARVAEQTPFMDGKVVGVSVYVSVYIFNSLTN